MAQPRIIASMTIALHDLGDGELPQPVITFSPVGILTVGRIDRLLPFIYKRITEAQVLQAGLQQAAQRDLLKEAAE